ncbi:amino acid adenylation domain-containing protein, partial [Ensifer sp. ENS09]|uniref:non-ribosomal peptide synthetase n=2 Tax=Ensifer sp. ENS09 TaxID=2769263 RepID=UPI001780DD12
LDILSDEERRLLLETWNQTAADYPSEKCIHELFEEQVAKTPEATAVVYDGQSLSYGELNARANRLAHYLIDAGVKPDTRVGICVERSPAMVVGLLAILKAGGAYVPLDPSYPSERLGQILADATPLLLLCDAVGRGVLRILEDDSRALPLLVDLIADAALWADRVQTNPLACTLGLTSHHLAYVIYTSGSTGVPKGVPNEHLGLVNRLVWMQDAYALGSADTVLQKTPFSFDVSGWEFFWTLLNGAVLVLANPGAHKDTGYLINLITQHEITTIHFVPSMLGSFIKANDVARCVSLRRIICSGEALPVATAHACQKMLPGARLYNLYGPTEAAIDVTAWAYPTNFEGEVIPIGRPISNTQIYILDAYGAPVPLGVVGELYIGGAGVARGYL